MGTQVRMFLWRGIVGATSFIRPSEKSFAGRLPETAVQWPGGLEPDSLLGKLKHHVTVMEGAAWGSVCTL